MVRTLALLGIVLLLAPGQVLAQPAAPPDVATPSDLVAAGSSAAVLRERQRRVYERVGRAVWLTSRSGKPLGSRRSSEGPDVWRGDGLFYLSGVREPGYGIVLQRDPVSGRVVSTLFDPTGTEPRPGFDRVLPRNTMAAGVRRVGARELSSSVLTRARTIKGPQEVELLQRAIDVTCDGLNQAMRAIPTRSNERAIHTIIEAAFRTGGCQGPGFRSIVAGGSNALTLHYHENDAAYRRDALIKMDVGGELGGYTADVTRTVPADGSFSEVQRELYSLVLRANKAAIARTRPGVRLSSVEAAAERVINARGYSIPHRVSHWLGLAVHDVGPSHTTPLRPGMVFTVEPGVYLRAGTRVRVGGRTVRLQRGVGIRIEDVVLVTETGYRVLSTRAPKEIDAIETLMRPGPPPAPPSPKLLGIVPAFERP